MDNKLDLTSVSFLIPVRIDSPDRYKNLLLIIKYLTYWTDTHILVLEADDTSKISSQFLKKEVEYYFVTDTDKKFHRTRYINQLSKKVVTPYLCICDADVVIPVPQLKKTLSLLQQGYSYVLPYDGSLIMTGQEEKERFLEKMDPGIFDKNIRLQHVCGGAIFMNREDFIKAGMSNEHITSWGPDDVEQKKRIEILGLSMTNTEGALFHITHPRGQNSSYEDYLERIRLTGEYVKAASMSPVDLREYVSSWEWCTPQNTGVGILSRPEYYSHMKQNLDNLAKFNENDFGLSNGKAGMALAYYLLSEVVEKEDCIHKALALLESIGEKITSGFPDHDKVLVAWTLDFMNVHFHIPERFNMIGRKIESWLFDKLMTYRILKLQMPDGALAIAFYYCHLLINKREHYHYDPVYYREQLIFVSDEIYELLVHQYQLKASEDYTQAQLRDIGQAILLMDRLAEVGVNSRKIERTNIWLWETVIDYFGNRDRFYPKDAWPLFAVLRICECSHNWYLLKRVTEWCEKYTSQCGMEESDECTMNIQRYLWRKAGNRILTYSVPKSISGILSELKAGDKWEQEIIFM